MLVSLIMTTYNCADHFRQSMESALSQDYPDLELIIVDGGSTDGTVDLIREYEQSEKRSDDIRFRWVSEPDGGIYDAMNKGIRMAAGDLIAVFNDLFNSTSAVRKMAEAVEADPDCMGAHADLDYFDERTGKTVRHWIMGNGTISGGWMPAHPTLYLRRQVYDQYGLYDISYRSSADYEFMVRTLFGRENRLAYVPETLIRMFYGGTSSAGIRGYLQNIREAYRALKVNHVPRPESVILRRIVRTILQFR